MACNHSESDGNTEGWHSLFNSFAIQTLEWERAFNPLLGFEEFRLVSRTHL